MAHVNMVNEMVSFERMMQNNDDYIGYFPNKIFFLQK